MTPSALPRTVGSTAPAGPTASAVSDPAKVLANTLRPRLSVPNGCDQLGAASACPLLPYGSRPNRCQPSAATTQQATMTALTTNVGRRSSARSRRLAAPGAAAGPVGASAVGTSSSRAPAAPSSAVPAELGEGSINSPGSRIGS